MKAHRKLTFYDAMLAMMASSTDVRIFRTGDVESGPTGRVLIVGRACAAGLAREMTGCVCTSRGGGREGGNLGGAEDCGGRFSRPPCT